MDKKISIILSTYNEAKVIENTINEILKHVKNVEIIVVDDNSPDGTLEKVKKIKYPNLKTFSKKSRGLAAALLTGLINSSGDVIGWIDSNQPSLVKKLPDMISKLDNYHMVILSRYIEGGGDQRKGLRILSSKIINFCCRLILDSEIKDYTSGMFTMKRSVLTDVVPISYGHGEFFIEFLYKAKKKGIKILEFPFTQPPDDEGTTKTAPNILRFIYLGFFYITRIILLRFRRD